MFLSQPPLMLSWDGNLSPHVVSTNTELRAASLLLDGGENSVSIRLLLTLPITSSWGGGGVQTPDVVSNTAGVQNVHCQPSRMIVLGPCSASPSTPPTHGGTGVSIFSLGRMYIQAPHSAFAGMGETEEHSFFLCCLAGVEHLLLRSFLFCEATPSLVFCVEGAGFSRGLSFSVPIGISGLQLLLLQGQDR